MNTTAWEIERMAMWTHLGGNTVFNIRDAYELLYHLLLAGRVAHHCVGCNAEQLFSLIRYVVGLKFDNSAGPAVVILRRFEKDNQVDKKGKVVTSGRGVSQIGESNRSSEREFF